MNKLPGNIVSILAEGSIALIEVQVGQRTLCASLLGAQEDFLSWNLSQHVELSFNEMEVSIAKNLTGKISLRNRLPGKIVSLEFGKILTRVMFQLDDAHPVSAVITTRSALNLELQIGDEIEGLVKSNEMNLLVREIR